MNNTFQDPIVAEVRKNREEMFAEFGGDVGRLHRYLAEQQPTWEAAGFHYETEEKRQARIAWKKQQNEERARKIASV